MSPHRAIATAPSTVEFAWLVAGCAVAVSLITLWAALVQRQRARQALATARQRENYLRTIITSEPACVKTVSRDFELLTMNPAGLELMEAENMEQVQGADLRDVRAVLLPRIGDLPVELPAAKSAPPCRRASGRTRPACARCSPICAATR